MNFEKYLSDFNSTIDIQDFIFNFIIVAVLALVLKRFYTFFGRSPSDRDGFSNNFLVLALATFLIITVIKSSIALSLGLVGALSIVRFRAAIKDPEELTYLFLIIGLGVVGGANKPILALIFFPLILILIWAVNRYTTKKKTLKNTSILHIDSTVLNTVESISSILSNYTTYLEFRKQDITESRKSYSFICKFKDIQSIDAMTEELQKVDNNINMAIIDQPQLIV